MNRTQAALSSIAVVKGLVGGPFGSSLVNKDYEQDGIPVIRGTNLNVGNMVGGEFVFVSEAKFQRDLKRNSAEPGDLVFTQRGTLGQVAVVPSEPFSTYVISQSQMRLRVDPSLADPRYVYFACNSRSFLRQIDDNAITTGVPHINLGILGRLTIPLPDLSEQRAIAKVLGSLDDKIAANTKLAETLSKIATAHFDVSAKSGGKSVPLSEVVTTQYGVTTSSHQGPGPRFLRVTDINKKPWIEWDTTPFCTVSDAEWEKYKVQAGDILVARMADPGKAAFIDPGDPEAVFASYLVRLKSLNPDHAMFIYYFLRSPRYRNYAEGAMQGSVQKNMNAKVIVASEISLPDMNVLRDFNDAITDIRAQIQGTLKENRQLAAMRDALLPQLMSGKLRVKDAEKVIEDAL